MTMHSFLLIGQSNMAGRGEIDSVAPIENPHLFVARNARWQPMYVPVNPDRPFSGISLAESFADAYSREHDAIDVGLIPCADGGTTLAQWAPGSLLFDHAVAMARLCMRSSVLRAVLWHQGESDCTPQCSASYAERLTVMLRALREALAMPQLPILLGGLGDYLTEYDEATRRFYPAVNAALEHVAAQEAFTAFVPAQGLGCKPDHLHFDAPALRSFGVRYYEAYRQFDLPLPPDSLPPVNAEDGRAHSAMEAL